MLREREVCKTFSAFIKYLTKLEIKQKASGTYCIIPL